MSEIGRLKRFPWRVARVPAIVNERVPNLVSVIAQDESARLRHLLAARYFDELADELSTLRWTIKMAAGFATVLAGQANRGTATFELAAQERVVDLGLATAQIVPVHIDRPFIASVVEMLLRPMPREGQARVGSDVQRIWGCLAVAGGAARGLGYRRRQIDAVYKQMITIAEYGKGGRGLR